MAQLGLNAVRISDGALKLLSRYSWPGNVRELENIISRSVLKASSTPEETEFTTIYPSHLAADLGAAIYTNPSSISSFPTPLPAKISLRDEVKSFQIQLIKEALEKNGGSWAGAARDLEMNRSNLHNLATRLGLRQKPQKTRYPQE
jgi:anaerobic nitric oxide reductase transcription regulator